MKTKNRNKEYEVTITQLVAYTYTINATSEEEAQYLAELEMDEDCGEVISQQVEINETENED